MSTTVTKTPPLLTKREIAEHLDVSLPTVDRLRTVGLPALRGNVRFELALVMDWLRDETVVLGPKGTPDAVADVGQAE